MLFLTAQKIGAPEMLRIGYLTAMVPEEALDEEVDRLATILAGNAPKAMAGMKRAINEFARGKLDEAAADARHRDSMRGEEIKEGILAFAEKAGAAVLTGVQRASPPSFVMAGLDGVCGCCRRDTPPRTSPYPRRSRVRSDNC